MREELREGMPCSERGLADWLTTHCADATLKDCDSLGDIHFSSGVALTASERSMLAKLLLQYLDVALDVGAAMIRIWLDEEGAHVEFLDSDGIECGRDNPPALAASTLVDELRMMSSQLEAGPGGLALRLPWRGPAMSLDMESVGDGVSIRIRRGE